MASSTSLPSGAPMSAGPPDIMQRIERNTAEAVRWLKILTGSVIVLVLVTVFLFV